ncbi:MAG: c-type cytochrome [Betaproteobacteria bacterium]|nr:c-type cytochrome [Betaproteobacteria bacterium]
MNRILIFTALIFFFSGKVLAQHASRGQKLFGECAACHSEQKGVQSIGPDLHGVIGRKAGSLEDFRYSPAMKRSGLTWTPEAIEAYIADPQKVVPQNRMPYAGMADARDRADLVAYLKEAFK